MASVRMLPVYAAFVSVLLLVTSSAAFPSTIKGYLDKMPAGCEGLEFCFKNTSYPTQRIKDLLTKDYRVQLGDVREKFGHRFGFEETYQVDCPKTINYDPVFTMVDKDGLVRFVVQADSIFAQILRFETCDNPGRLQYSTEHFNDMMISKYHIACEQKSMPYSFLVLNLEGTAFEMVQSKTEVPVQCACLLK